jgi:hypothetical protein
VPRALREPQRPDRSQLGRLGGGGAPARPDRSALGDADGAAAHFEAAIALHRRWGSRPWLAITIRDYAASLPGACPVALIEEGEALARRLGLQTPISTKPAQ